MARSKAKTIRLLLDDGNLKGLISMVDSSWNSGELYSAPRNETDKLISSDACNRYGVYLLLSEDMVYIGQSKSLSRRIQQHKLKKDWWERVIVLTTSDDSLNKSDIDFMEAILIDKADKTGGLDSDNKKKGNDPKVDKFRKAELEQYLEEALFLIELIGVTVFEKSRKSGKKFNRELIHSIPSNTEEGKGIRQKGEAKRYIEEQGIKISKHYNYGKLQKIKNTFWLNPRVEQLKYQWDIILNNQEKSVMYYLSVPANAFGVSDDSVEQLKTRNDKPELLDLNIDAETFVDKKSNSSFKEYVIKEFVYK